MIVTLNILVIQQKISDNSFSYYSPYYYMRVQHGYASWMRPVVMNAWPLPRGQKERCTTRLRIAQNCRAVCTKESGLNASGHRDVYTLLNERRLQEARSILCHTCQ